MSQVQVSKIVSLSSTEHVDDSVVCSLVFSTVASLLIKRILISRGILYVLTTLMSTETIVILLLILYYCLTRLFSPPVRPFLLCQTQIISESGWRSSSNMLTSQFDPPGVLFGIIPRQTGTGHLRKLKPLTGMLGWLKTSTSPGPNGIQTS